MAFGLNTAPKYIVKLEKPGEPEEKDEKFNVRLEGQILEQDKTPLEPGKEFPVTVEVLLGSQVIWSSEIEHEEDGEFSVVAEGLENKKYQVRARIKVEFDKKVYPFKSKNHTIDLSKKEGGPKGADQIEVDVRQKSKSDDRVEYDLIVCPVNNKHKGVKGTIYAFPDDSLCEIVNDHFDTDGKKPTIISVTARGNTGLTVRMDGTDISKDILLDGPTQFHGKGWAIFTGFMLALTVLLFAVATWSSFFHPLPAPPANEADTWWSATDAAPVKASIAWMGWWAAFAVSLLATIVGTVITTTMNTKTLVWKARKLNASRKYETKEPPKDKDGKEKTAAPAHADGTPAWLTWFTAITNMLDLLREGGRHRP